MRPRVVRVDGRGQRGELLLDVSHAAMVVVGEPRWIVADVCVLVQNIGEFARLGHVARDKVQAEFGDQLLVGGVSVADHLTAELNDSAVVERDLLDATADAVAGLEDKDIGASPHQVTGGGQTGKAGAEYDDVVSHCVGS